MYTKHQLRQTRKRIGPKIYKTHIKIFYSLKGNTICNIYIIAQHKNNIVNTQRGYFRYSGRS